MRQSQWGGEHFVWPRVAIGHRTLGVYINDGIVEMKILSHFLLVFLLRWYFVIWCKLQNSWETALAQNSAENKINTHRMKLCLAFCLFLFSFHVVRNEFDVGFATSLLNQIQLFVVYRKTHFASINIMLASMECVGKGISYPFGTADLWRDHNKLRCHFSINSPISNVIFLWHLRTYRNVTAQLIAISNER